MAHIPLQAPFMHQRTKHRVFDATIVTKIAQISKGREDYYIAPRKRNPSGGLFVHQEELVKQMQVWGSRRYVWVWVGTHLGTYVGRYLGCSGMEGQVGVDDKLGLLEKTFFSLHLARAFFLWLQYFATSFGKSIQFIWTPNSEHQTILMNFRT